MTHTDDSSMTHSSFCHRWVIDESSPYFCHRWVIDESSLAKVRWWLIDDSSVTKGRMSLFHFMSSISLHVKLFFSFQVISVHQFYFTSSRTFWFFLEFFEVTARAPRGQARQGRALARACPGRPWRQSSVLRTQGRKTSSRFKQSSVLRTRAKCPFPFYFYICF